MPQHGPQRLAYLVNQYPKVSHTFIRREILALERRGLSVSRFSIRGWDSPVADPVDEEERAKTRYILQAGPFALLRATLATLLGRPRASFKALKAALSMSRRSLRPWPYHLIWFAEACLLRQWLELDRIDHLHAHFGTNSADVALLQNLLGGPDYSFTIHGPDEFDQAPMLNLPRKVEGARFVAVISAFTRSQLMRAIPARLWPRLQVVHCGLDEAFFASEPAPLPDSPTLLCIGRLNAQKGHVTLLQAFAALARPDARLILAGDGELRDLVEETIRNLGLTDKVTITGWISSDEVMRLITQSRVIVQPSYMEGLPVVLMEAMAQGRPVISTFVAGIPELVQNGTNGWLVPAGDQESLARAMSSAIDEDPTKLRQMGLNGMARVRTRHHIDTEAERLAALFRSPEMRSSPKIDM